MVTTPNPATEVGAELSRMPVPAWPSERSAFAPTLSYEGHPDQRRALRPSGADALQALLAFAALHQQVRQRRALASRHNGFDAIPHAAEFEAQEQFVLDEVLQLVAERAVAITGADGLGIALAEDNEIVLRASAGSIKPDVGARIQRDSAFSGACFRTAQIIRCDDTETDDRVNLYACRQLGARSLVAVPLCGRRRVIGLLEAFSAEPFGFNDSDVASLELLAELILGAVKPEDEDRFAIWAQVAEVDLTAPASTQTFFEQTPAKKAVAIAPPALPIQADDVASAPVAAMAAPPLTVEAKHVSAALAFDAIPQSEPLGRHPGVVVVLALVVVCALGAGGFWWKLTNAHTGKVLVGPIQQMSTGPVADAKHADGITSSDSSSTIQSGASGNAPTSDSGPATVPHAPAESTTAGATSQELSKMPRITGVRHWSSADSSTVVLDLQDQVQYEAHRLANPDRIYFDLHDTSLASDLDGKAIDVGDALLSRVRVAQPASGLTRVVLETRGNSNYSVSLEPNPYRLVVQVRKVGVDTQAQVSLFPGTVRGTGLAKREKFAIVVPPPTREDLQMRASVPKMRIVVDAGHGGWDLGTVGRRGLLEKDLVLEIAQRLGKLLESRLGAEVILTRNDDNYIPLDERAGMANQAQADLFVSVHANYSDLPSARGVETYYTNLFSAPNAKDLETREQDHAKSSSATALSATELQGRIEQSRRLAASVQRSLYGTLAVQNPGLRDRGVKAASYVVLTETAMPGILAEVSFVSSPTDEQKLRSDGYREQIAEALYKGIARYAVASRGVKVAAR